MKSIQNNDVFIEQAGPLKDKKVQVSDTTMLSIAHLLVTKKTLFERMPLFNAAYQSLELLH